MNSTHYKPFLYGILSLILSTIFFGIISLSAGYLINSKHVSCYPVLNTIIGRTSSRAMSGKTITEYQLKQLFEAARWAPSAYNEQPWRFVYATRESNHWNTFLDLLVPANRSWAQDAAVLIAIISKNNFTLYDKPSVSHSFDTGAAWENLALQATNMGLVSCAIGGFDEKKARQKLNISDEYTIEAFCAVGHPGNFSDLPARVQELEMKTDRKPLKTFVFEGAM